MKWSLGVTTAPRITPTLSKCLKSLHTAGWSDGRIFAEPGSTLENVVEGYAVTQRDQVLGVWPNWFLALNELFQRDPQADAYMLVQDDAVFCNNVRWLLEKLPWDMERIGVVSPYCPADYSQPNTGLHVVNANWTLIGALTYIFPSSAIQCLLSHGPAVSYRKEDPTGGLKHIDSVVGRWCESTGRQALYFSPSLVQHVGEDSTIDKSEKADGSRHANQFVGEDFDARELLSILGQPWWQYIQDPYLSIGNLRRDQVPIDRPPFHDFSISRYCWEILRSLIRPGMKTLEFGSGLSTLLFDAAGCNHTAIEHDQQYAAPSRSVIVAPITGSIPWYSWKPMEQYDLVFIDGPPEKIGRKGVLPMIGEISHANTLIVVDDTHRDHEREVATQICKLLDLQCHDFKGHRRSFSVCVPRGHS